MALLFTSDDIAIDAFTVDTPSNQYAQCQSNTRPDKAIRSVIAFNFTLQQADQLHQALLSYFNIFDCSGGVIHHINIDPSIHRRLYWMSAAER